MNGGGCSTSSTTTAQTWPDTTTTTWDSRANVVVTCHFQATITNSIVTNISIHPGVAEQDDFNVPLHRFFPLPKDMPDRTRIFFAVDFGNSMSP